MENITPRPTEEELRLFAHRIELRLIDQPLDLDPSSHQRQVAGLLRQAGDASFYQLLDLVPTATAQEVYEAYDQVARLVHPVNARRLGLSGREGVLEMLFERITQGYLTLSQPERRKAYDRELPAGAWSAAWSPAAGQRRDEARELARQYYERALVLVAAEDFHFAIELLQQAARADSRPEIHALLGKLQAKNPRWLRAASENLQKAIELGSRDPELPAALDEVLRRLHSGEAVKTNATAEASRKREVSEVEVLDPEEFDVPLPEARKYRRR